MSGQVWSEADLIRDWLERETRHLDLIESWEVLCSVYDTLRFSDPIPDDRRLDEFKYIIAETNKFLTRTKNALMGTSTIEECLEYLEDQIGTQKSKDIIKREQIAFGKLKQRWISMNAQELVSMKNGIDREGEDDE